MAGFRGGAYEDLCVQIVRRIMRPTVQPQVFQHQQQVTVQWDQQLRKMSDAVVWILGVCTLWVVGILKPMFITACTIHTLRDDGHICWDLFYEAEIFRKFSANFRNFQQHVSIFSLGGLLACQHQVVISKQFP